MKRGIYNFSADTKNEDVESLFSRDVVTSLALFGVDQTDGLVYLGLLQSGPVTVGTLSAKIKLDRGKVYRCLTRLRNLGIISTTFSNPTVCSALSPKDALDNLVEKKEDEIIKMKNMIPKLKQSLDSIFRKLPLSNDSAFSIIQGRSNIYPRIGNWIAQSAGTVYIATTIEDIIRMYHTSIPEKIKMGKKNGAIIKVFTSINNENEIPLIKRLQPSEIRIGTLPSKSRIVVAENKFLFMSGAINDLMDLNYESDSVLFTDSQAMIKNMYSLCNHLWKKSQKVELTVS